MSHLNRHNRPTVKQFAAVPPLLNLPPIQRGDASISSLSEPSQPLHTGIDIEEGCIITKSVKYTHELTRMINTVHSDDSESIEEHIEIELKIIHLAEFSLDHPCNLVYLEAFIHTSLDLYAFIALAPSSKTVDGLIEMVQTDNDRRQQYLERTGLNLTRSLDFLHPSFSDPEYELICLHPEHFLPHGACLPVYNPTTGRWKTYVVSQDRRLRESVDPASDPLPPFRHTHNRDEAMALNIFLVAINAQIKFRRYFRIIPEPHANPLPDDVHVLMRRVDELVELLYWKQKVTMKQHLVKEVEEVRLKHQNTLRGIFGE